MRKAEVRHSTTEKGPAENPKMFSGNEFGFYFRIIRVHNSCTQPFQLPHPVQIVWDFVELGSVFSMRFSLSLTFRILFDGFLELTTMS
jgi:hypothetical protein